MAASKNETQSRSDLVADIAADFGVAQVLVEEVVRDYENRIAKALTSGENVRLAGFGSFKVNQRAARTGRNPHTGESIQIAASKVVKFTPAKSLKEAVSPKPAAKAAKKTAAKSTKKAAAKKSTKK